MSNYPFVSVVIPCLNEERHIAKCLDSIIGNDYPAGRIEILVVDGMSSDGTCGILEKYRKENPCLKIFKNDRITPPFALNLGIKNSKGEIIIRMDAHSTYKNDYISKCVKYLSLYNDADNVGGVWVVDSENKGLLAKAIVISLSHPFGVGNAYYRIGITDRPREVDTVPFGCFRRSLFEKIGFFNEALPRNEDSDFNRRIRESGGKIMLFPDIVCYYQARTDFLKFCKHNFANGVLVTNQLRSGKNFLSLRHFIPFVFIMSLIVFSILSLSSKVFFDMLMFLITSYILTALCFAFKIAIREKRAGLVLFMPLMFFSLHFSYGFGSIRGLIK